MSDRQPPLLPPGEPPAGEGAVGDRAGAAATAAGPFAEVAVPLPLPALAYAVPPDLSAVALPGVRVRVRVGKRRLVGTLLARRAEPPPGIEVRPLEGVLDREPVLTADLLELATFTADYYQAPIGEVVRAMLPSDLPPWGDRRVWLTDAGALAPPRDEAERAVIEALHEAGRLRLAELQRRLGRPDLPAVVDRLAADGRVAVGEGRRRTGARYLSAVELPAGDLEAQRAAAGRSAPGRAVVELLSGLGRPATVEEVTAVVGCTPAVVSRLVQLGVLRRFTQVERLPLDRHLLAAEEVAPITLHPDQERSVAELAAAAARGGFAPFLLAGITGSGKTEVYLRAVEAALAAGRTALVLVPEIALVPALARTVERRFGERLAILHSALGAHERHQEWERVRRGEARVVLGPRSAVFAPLEGLGIVVVDEEQDPAYKQETAPRYHGRDLALVRAQRAGAVAVLASATPSLESRLNAERGKVVRLELTERVAGGRLPEGILVDLKEEGVVKKPGEVVFSARLRDEIAAALAGGGQVILLRNRRGYSPILLCRACGDDLRCEGCGLPRTFHRRERVLVCHYCGGRLAVPTACPSCGEAALEPIGAGTERVEERFAELFPGVAVDVLDRDAVRRPGGAVAVLERFARGEVRVLVGTQMVAKGHHFPEVAVAAVLAADTYLGFPDFRAVERTYNLLVQLAGRAGRGVRPGKVVIQSYHPDHYAIRAALDHDDAAFAAEELRFRRVFHYPPYTRMVQLLARHRDRAKAEAAMAELADRLRRHPLARDVRISGPAPAPLERIRDRWRFQLLARAADGRRLRELVRRVVPESPTVEMVVDVDPQQLL